MTMITESKVLLRVVSVALFITGAATARAEDTILVPDDGLREVLREAVGAPFELTEASLSAVTSISTNSNDIVSLTGLEYCTNLEYLSISGSPIADLGPLAELGTLITLRLIGCGITDISRLQGLRQMTRLDLSRNQVSDLEALRGFENLERATLSNNLIEDVGPLEGLAQLEILDLANNSIENVQPLAALTKLTTLQLSQNKVSNIAGLSGLVDLESLYLTGNQVADITPLSSLVSLEWIFLSGNLLMSIESLGSLSSVLNYVDLSRNQISDLQPLATCKSLRVLNISNNQVESLSPLTGVERLRELSISGNLIADLTPIMALPVLQKLWAGPNPYDPAACLEHVPALRARGVEVGFSGPCVGLVPACEPEDLSTSWPTDGYHSLDFERDFKISMTELLRAIQFYNSGKFQCDQIYEITDDGYSFAEGTDHCCKPHDADYMEQDWRISLRELMRIAQFYNIGGYYFCEEGEDGFCAGRP